MKGNKGNIKVFYGWYAMLSFVETPNNCIKTKYYNSMNGKSTLVHERCLLQFIIKKEMGNDYACKKRRTY